jgi:hypothetical protein
MDDEYCKVYDSEDAFTAVVQGLLAALALASLYIKRHNEVPRRKFMTWWLDTSKQGIGAVFAHFSNMLIAAWMSFLTRGDFQLDDQCAWYAISFVVDTTMGLWFSLIFLGLLETVARDRNWESLINTGVYEGADGMRHWRHQVISWLIILAVVKFLVILFIWAFSPILAWLGDFLFSPFQQNIKFELLFVMIIFPGILNFFYFWVADHYLKAGPEHSCAHESDEDDQAEAGEYIATDENGGVNQESHQHAHKNLHFEMPHVKPNTVRTLI